PGDWGSVLGWRDLATSTVGFRQRPRDPFWLDLDLSIDLFILVAVVLPVLVLVLLGPVAGCAVIAALLTLAYALWRSALRRKDAVRAR
ncbi:hypothetical protein RGC52_07995, partial [Helicobacter pylori]|uniref:hypothetical protein n=1 Tax=Helicobacter pylori TaxID=210 RepID=UPI0029288A63